MPSAPVYLGKFANASAVLLLRVRGRIRAGDG
jgi:hypothetical protein